MSVHIELKAIRRTQMLETKCFHSEKKHFRQNYYGLNKISRLLNWNFKISCRFFAVNYGESVGGRREEDETEYYISHARP